jgi:hypothetical protein
LLDRLLINFPDYIYETITEYATLTETNVVHDTITQFSTAFASAGQVVTSTATKLLPITYTVHQPAAYSVTGK